MPEIDDRFAKELIRGHEFQDFAPELLAKRIGLVTRSYVSKQYQTKVGESMHGFEYKLDSRCTETGRLAIEIEARHNQYGSWYPAGVCRLDNTRVYVQGNYHRVFVFWREELMRHRAIKPQRDFLPTSRGFFLPIAEAEASAIWSFTVMPHERPAWLCTCAECRRIPSQTFQLGAR